MKAAAKMKTIGTLEEIGAQVGDVVTFDSGWYVHEITQIKEDGTYISMVNDVAPGEPSLTAKDWRIITRAAKSPIRTVTRKEIVPGIYGKVSVHQLRPDNGGYYIAMVNSLTHKENTVHSPMTEADLTAAIKTLTEIRDAMETP